MVTSRTPPPMQEMTTAGYPIQRRLRRRARVYGLRTFLDPGCPADFAGAFRDNVRAFLRDCAEGEDYTVGGMPVWCILLVDESIGAVAPLYAVEECARRSPRPLCDHCRCAGWSHHLVSRRRYHFIIPSDDDWDRDGLRSDALELQSHLLHGLVHCNGFGHLLCVNGRDGGSHFVSGTDVMDLWDRLCTALRVRYSEITVDDSSRKGPMELRLLLSVASGTTWFGRWGYTFRPGSFGVTHGDYRNAVDLLGSLDLDGLIEEFMQIRREGEQLQRIVLTYRRLAEFDLSGPHRLATLRDLLRFLLDFKHRQVAVPPPRAARKRPRDPAMPQGRRQCLDFEAFAAELDSRWPTRRLRATAQVIADALERRPRGMTRQEVRDSARLTIGDTGLIDFVLKSIGDCAVGGRVVRRAQNPVTKVLEFSLDDLSGGAGDGGEGDPVAAPSEPRPSAASTRVTHLSQGQVERDTLWVYKHLLLRARPGAAEVVLHSRRWAKAWGLRDEEDDQLRFLCGWMPSEEELASGLLTKPPPPPDVVVLPPHATVGDLLEEAGRAMRDTYCALEGFQATVVEGLAGEEGEPLFGCGTESGARVWVSGAGAELEGEVLVYEGGKESWTVRCGCGARDDDGERMVACDVCEVWQHTRCAGITDGDAVPPLFVCGACGRTILHLRRAMMANVSGEEHDGDVELVRN